MQHCMKFSQLLLILIAASSSTTNENSFACHAFGKKQMKIRSTNKLGSGNGRDDAQMQQVPNGNYYAQDVDSTTIFYDSFLLYRGGDNDSHETEDAAGANNDANGEEDTTAEGVEAEKKIHVSLHSSSSPTSSSGNNYSKDAASSQTVKQQRSHGKKFNAVGDPDGNDSSSDSESDSEELEEHQGAEEDGSFETLMELASRREGMKQKIELMEEELRQRRRNVEEDYDGDEMDLDVITDNEDNEEELDLDDVVESTSYHLSGSDAIKQDDILRRQRKYKRGELFQKDGRTSSSSKTSSGDTTTTSPPSTASTVKTTIDSETMDNLLISAFQSMVFLPPPMPRLPSLEGSTSLRNIDVSSRRRLDRRTLYHGLLAELGGSHHHHHDKGSSSKKENVVDSMIRRKYLDAETTRALKGALSLACQPRWRERLMVGWTSTSNSNAGARQSSSDTSAVDEEDDEYDEYDDEEVPGWWYRGGVCLFPPADEDESLLPNSRASLNHRGFQQSPQQFMSPPNGMNIDGDDGQGSFFGPAGLNNEDEMGGGSGATPVRPWRCTMGMQETVAMALAHSLSCGLALIDDEALASVRKSVEASVVDLASSARYDDGGVDVAPAISPDELRNAALLGHLVRLANEGKLNLSSCEDNTLEKNAISFGRISDRMERDMKLGLDDPNDDLAVESLRLMKEDERTWYESNGSDDDKKTSPLPLVLFVRSDCSSSILKSKSAVECLAHECVNKEGIHLLVLGGKGIDASTTVLPDRKHQAGTASGRIKRQQSIPNQQGKPFSFMSNFPPGSPEFSAQMQNNQQGQPGSFSANNINASGVNDPEGSKRFNIFLARTVDQFGKPQIMGTIAPPQAGNLFPTILSNMAIQNLQKIREEGVDEDNEQQAMFIKQMEEIVSHAHKMADEGQQPPDSSNAAFFNATINSPFGSEVFNNVNGEGDENNPMGGQFNPPPEAVRRAIQDAMSGVIDRLAQMSSSPTGGGIPMSIAKAFSQVLSNENLRRGIADNLSRAAPALIDPRCQGVMLSVYVPPGVDHVNVGMMPGDQFKNQKRPQTQSRTTDKSSDVSHAQHGMGGWLNKILSSSEKGRSPDGEIPAVPTPESEKAPDASEVQQAPNEKMSPEETLDPTHSTKGTSSKRSSRKSKRKDRMDRARTLAVAAAALAGSKKERKERERRQHVKLTQEQKAQRNLTRLQALCRNVPIPNPIDPVRLRSWDAWADREQGSVVFRKNRGVLASNLNQRSLRIDEDSGTKGAGIVLRQMMSVKDITEEMDDIIKCAVEIEAGKSQRHHESPWGGAKASTESKSKPSKDKTLTNFLLDDAIEAKPEITTQLIHPHSLESALSLISGVSPSPGSQSSASSSSGALASHRTKEDLMALAQDKHERALIPNCVTPQDIGVTYDMIGGLTEVKELLRQSITYPLKFPHLYSEGIAREAVKGVLLFGPPGTVSQQRSLFFIGGILASYDLLMSVSSPLTNSQGKTMLAKAVATEGGASFLSVDASSVENKWLGESEKNAKAVFTLARRLAPCVIFIDEVDSLLSSREGSSDDSAHGTLTSVKTTMMSEWDGLNSGTNGKGEAGSDRVVVIGSTNRPFDLDEAVLRRFPRRILVDLPDLETRKEILEVTLAENRLGPDVNLTMVAERLEGYTGSDLKEVCREAVVQISHEQARMLDRGELLDEDDEEDVFESSSSGFQMLRPVTMRDFENAMRKLKRSVSETGKELAKVWDWNDEYGEIKKTNKRDVLPQMMNMFL